MATNATAKENGDSDSLVDLASVFELMYRRKLAMAVALAVVVLLTAIAYLLSDRIYSAVGRVALDRQDEEVIKVGNNPMKPLATDSPAVDTEVQVIRSPETAQAVVKRLNLADKVGFGKTDESDIAPVKAREGRALGKVLGGLTVQREGTSYAITISYRSPDPAMAAEVANAVMDVYIAGQVSGKSENRSQQIKVLASRIDELRGQVMEAESAVAQYRSQANLVNVSPNDASAQGTVATLDAQLAAARAESAAANARAAASRSGSVTDITSNPVISTLRSQLAELRAKRSELAGRYGPQHPSLVGIDRQIAEMDSAISAESARVRAGVNADAQIASQRASSIAASISQQRGAILSNSRASVRLNELERVAESSRQLYQGYLDQYRQALAAQGAERSNAYVIARAMVPFLPQSPNLLVFAVGGVLAGVLAAGLVAFLLELTERGYRNRTELERAVGLPVIASVPNAATVKDNPHTGGSPISLADHVVSDEGSVVTEAIRSIRTRLRVGQAGQVARSVAVVSSLPGEGKTSTALCLARVVAMAGHRALLVDCDMRRRATSRSVEGTLKAGLGDVLRGNATLEEAIVQDQRSGAFFLPQREFTPGDFDLIASRKMEALIKTLSEQFDLVILDTPPVLPVAEARAVAAMADVALMVVRWRKTPVGAVDLSLAELHRADANVMGLVLAQVDVRSPASNKEIYYYQRYDSGPATAAE